MYEVICEVLKMVAVCIGNLGRTIPLKIGYQVMNVECDVTFEGVKAEVKYDPESRVRGYAFVCSVIYLEEWSNEVKINMMHHHSVTVLGCISDADMREHEKMRLCQKVDDTYEKYRGMLNLPKDIERYLEVDGNGRGNNNGADAGPVVTPICAATQGAINYMNGLKPDEIYNPEFVLGGLSRMRNSIIAQEKDPEIMETALRMMDEVEGRLSERISAEMTVFGRT